MPVPGVNIDEVTKRIFDSNANNALGLVNMFSGNAVERLSIISLELCLTLQLQLLWSF